MISSSSIVKNQGVEVSNFQLVMSDAYPPSMFCVIPNIAMKGDSSGAFPSIPPKIILMHYV